MNHEYDYYRLMTNLEFHNRKHGIRCQVCGNYANINEVLSHKCKSNWHINEKIREFKVNLHMNAILEQYKKDKQISHYEPLNIKKS